MYRIKDTRNLLILLIIYFFLLVKVSYAGDSQYSPPFHTHQISIYTTVDGLPSGFINCMDQDHEENLWIGTLNGVSKFDGKSFTNYGVKQGFTNKAVTAILCDNKGYTWCGIIDGSLFRFDGLEWEQMQEIQKMI